MHAECVNGNPVNGSSVNAESVNGESVNGNPDFQVLRNLLSELRQTIRKLESDFRAERKRAVTAEASLDRYVALRLQQEGIR